MQPDWAEPGRLTGSLVVTVLGIISLALTALTAGSGTVVDNDRGIACYAIYNVQKTTFCFEKYFSSFHFCKNYSVSLAQLRTSNNSFPVNRRRFEGIARNERICHKKKNVIL